MAKYELNTPDAKQLLKDIHTIATSLKTLSELAKKDAAKKEEKEAIAGVAAALRNTSDPAAMKTAISDLFDAYASPCQVPLEPDPDERG